MLITNNTRLMILSKYLTRRSYLDNTYCYLKTYRDNYKHLVQVFGYSTKFDTKDKKLPVDSRVEALREKLIYCDHLDRDRVRPGILKRFLRNKLAKNIEKEMQTWKLVHDPVYSVLLDTGEKNDVSLQGNQEEEVSDASSRKDVTRPVHMPYASTDKYSNVNIAADNSIEVDFNESTLPLNEKYKSLYEKYLIAKNILEENTGEDLTLNEYMEKKGISVSYKTDLSNVPTNWMTDYEQFDDTLNDETWLNNYGTPDPNSRVSPVPCGGCGALLHCKDHALPGYLPSELFLKKNISELRLMICQRCHFMKYYNAMLEVKVSPDKFVELIKVIKTKKCAVILMVDLTDFPCSIWPEIKSVLHPRTLVFVVGNKVDLLPQDSPKFFTHVKECLSKAVENTGISKEYIKHVALISAKTGYGIEELINKLHNLWKYKGDVYVIGCTNVGKSSLFNTLLQSDYCKVQAVDLIQRATVSPWPGTTLRLLKFPILNPQRWRLYMRMMRLQEEKQQLLAEQQIRVEQFKQSRNLKYVTLQSRIGKTFQPKSKLQQTKDPFAMEKYTANTQNFGFDETKEEFKYSRWCYDTPGTIQPDQILDLLTTEELLSVLPKQIIIPRTFILHPNQTIFLAGIGRLDYLEGCDYIRCTIFASTELPITMTLTADADDVYNELLNTKAFVVPENDSDRLKHWPALGSKEMKVTGIGRNISVADVVLSSAGWMAISVNMDDTVLLRAWSPQARGLHLRMPALLQKTVALRGDRIFNLPTYKIGQAAFTK
ncbi:nitric oxide-associated protein 1 [Odontomachus brunneus]|uniref:nitric oxide-associated protein 1 n=1 Tax=Odontomachus brunneus TaxID=486640 RepID=UPI0013F1FC72|nr:nitric oxide-associated protein 1 [Odontomachus brunneus]XP_032679629.1 nitric oxide-associated protein 1 [Odontomachus brunneus]